MCRRYQELEKSPFMISAAASNPSIVSNKGTTRIEFLLLGSVPFSMARINVASL